MRLDLYQAETARIAAEQNALLAQAEHRHGTSHRFADSGQRAICSAVFTQRISIMKIANANTTYPNHRGEGAAL